MAQNMSKLTGIFAFCRGAKNNVAGSTLQAPTPQNCFWLRDDKKALELLEETPKAHEAIETWLKRSKKHKQYSKV